MTVLPERISQSAFDGSRLRVVLMLDLYDGAQEQFLEAYEHLRRQVASVPGHVSDQLCQSIENPSQWLITSEWQSAPPFLAWVNSEEHVEMVQPLHSCVRNTRSLRYSVLRETGNTALPTAESARGGLQSSPRRGDGVIRHALTFTVKPGSEDVVAKILSDYASPEARVDENTRLRRTSLFIHGNRVVRAVEVEGDLLTALRHVAKQPQVRAVEEAINPYLEQDRDLSDANSARTFFTRAALPMVHHEAVGRHAPSEVARHALFYQAREGCGTELARLLADQDEATADDPSSPIDSSTIFQRDDVVVRLIDVVGPLDARPTLALGLGTAKAKLVARLLDTGTDGAPAGEQEVTRFLARSEMTPITDRSAPTS